MCQWMIQKVLLIQKLSTGLVTFTIQIRHAPKLKRLCRHSVIKRFTQIILQLKSATRIGR
jgi:hypothetical protein